ncbi:MAG: DUF3501 family protein [Thermaerobacter sp.]|nr:DUF3501 family protein [Thermaerobacter sp.]
MRRVAVEELLGLAEYQTARDQIRDDIIRYKRTRRVALGDLVSLLFENHRTLWFQTQEMLRAEHIADPIAVAEELAVYNDMLPAGLALAATLLIEIPDSSQIPAVLKRLTGVEDHVVLWLDDQSIPAAAEPGRSKEDKTSSVHYLTFALSPQQGAQLQDPTTVVQVGIRHPGYTVQTTLPEAVRASLAADLDLG